MVRIKYLTDQIKEYDYSYNDDEFDAYGKVEKTIIENNNVSKYNPFIYKGYYYD